MNAHNCICGDDNQAGIKVMWMMIMSIKMVLVIRMLIFARPALEQSWCARREEAPFCTEG